MGFHGNWRNLMVLSGFEIAPTTVNVDGLIYEVSAVADEEGEVTTSVTSVISPDAEVPRDTQAEALYAAGILTQKLEGIFDRPAVATLPTNGRESGVQRGGPLVKELAQALWAAVLGIPARFGDEDVSAGRRVCKSGCGGGPASGHGGNGVGPSRVHNRDVEGTAKPNWRCLSNHFQ